MHVYSGMSIIKQEILSDDENYHSLSETSYESPYHIYTNDEKPFFSQEIPKIGKKKRGYCKSTF